MRPNTISRPFGFFDVPQPKNVSAKFTYNFFVPDEMVSEAPSGVQRIPDSYTPARGLGKAERDKLTTKSDIAVRMPRFIEITWRSAQFDTLRSSDGVSRSKIDETSDIINDSFSGIGQTLDPNEVIDESEINFNVISGDIGGNDLFTRLGERFIKSLQLRGISTGSTTDKINSIIDDVLPGGLELDVISRSMTARDESNKVTLINGIPFNRRDFEDVVRTQVTINDKFVLGITRESAISPMGEPLRNELTGSVTGTRQDETPNDAEADPDISSKYIVQAAGASFSDNGSDTLAKTGKLTESVRHVGYVIDKFAIGQRKPMKSFIVPAAAKYFLDDEVKYGTQYSYAVRTLAAFTFTEQDRNPQFDQNTGKAEIIKTTVLVKSRQSQRVAAITSEDIPPPSPADIRFLWNYDSQTMTLAWSFPFNPQRDIKEWQIFRRSSVDEPFRLIRVISFDDSVIPTPRFEDSIDPVLIRRPTRVDGSGETFPHPDTKFTDSEFTKDSKFIYAVCSVDAHSFISNYSEQFEVSFDRIRNRLVRRLVSPSGAPKQYPNTFLKAELSLDSVVSSGVKRAKIYFDPEYLRVMRGELESGNNKTTDLGLFKKTVFTEDSPGKQISDMPGCVYKLVFLNTDRQKQQTLNIGIYDPNSSLTSGQ